MEELEALALELHAVVKRHGVQAGISFVQARVMPARRNSSGLLPTTVDNSKPLNLFQDVCLTMNLYAAAVVTAIAQHMRPEQEHEDFSDLLQFLGEKSTVRFLEFALKNKLQCFARALVASQPRMRSLLVLRGALDNFFQMYEPRGPGE